MPIYNYECDDCGPFSDWRPMSVAAAPADCPTCGDLGPRMPSAPMIANMNPHRRIAHQRNEKSADQPEVESRKPHDHGACGQHGHGHTHGHTHGHSRHSHRHGPSRPWMIGH